MVRVISEKLFSPPRSRHSSGETVDKELAARAVEVLSSLNSRRLELSDCESSSDSHWDSEVDVEGDGTESSASRDQPGDNGKPGGTSDVLRKRKERRRERNKLSAQAYRVRRKEQTVKQQTVLKTLQEQNARLKTTVQNLEDELQKVRHSLRQRGYLATFPLPSPIPTTAPSPKTCTDTVSVSPGTSGPAAGEKFASFSQLCEQATMSADGQGQAMDNAQSRQQQLAPVVDNFLFSKSLPTLPSSGAINAPTPTFSFPASPVMGARHNFGAGPFLGAALPTISEKPDDHFGHHQHHHPYPKSQLHQHADLNANANDTSFALANANTINANANMFGMYNNSNRMNNNNNLYQTVPVSGEAGACADLMAQRAPVKVCKV